MAVIWVVSVTLFIVYSEVQGDISVTTTVNPVGLVGNNEVELVCTYSLTSMDRVFSMSWKRETTKDSGTYKQLASFSPPGTNQAPATLTNLTNPSVFGRVVLTNPTDSSLTAIIKFTSVVCGDERKYQCAVLGLNSGIQANPASETSLTVTAHPNAKSFGEVEMVPSSNIAEGRTVQFTCTSNVGRPAGTFLWTKYRGVSESVGSTVTSTTQTSPSTDCTFTGSSVINIPMTKDDNGVIIRCTLQQETLSDPTNNAYYRQTNPISVYYQTRTPTIIKNPTKAIHYEGEDLTLTCAAEGNPPPTYIWRLNRGHVQVGTRSQLSLTDININQSGDYVCEAKNNFTGNTYNLSKMISITIEASPPVTSTDFVTTTTPGPSEGHDSKDDDATRKTTADGESVYTAGVVMLCISVILLSLTVGLGIFISRNKRLPFFKTPMMKDLGRFSMARPTANTGQAEDERSRYQHLDIAAVAGPSVYQTLGQTPDGKDRNYDVLNGRSAPNVYDELSGPNAGPTRQYINIALTEDDPTRNT
ncbi:nectin-4-like isoform X2 [Pecten maximus]|uniref:nectin-4-like isoform X2 n=1 Tax=Pecten maximus TaxID=6579 RepID=UPI001458245F|nr:nectin-4-like isoform X2 [Pecten maximus]